MLNKAILMGRLTRDPELRHTQTNTPVTSFTLAVDRSFTKQGEEKKTDFIDIVAWRNTAEFVSKYFRRGMQVVVVGRIQIREWKDKEGNNRRTAEIIADETYFADSRRDSGPSSSPYGAAPYASDYSSQEPPAALPRYSEPSPSYSDFTDMSADEDDLPF